MISVGTDRMSLGQAKKFGIDVTDYLSEPGGTTTSISGTPDVAGVNCAVEYLASAAGVVFVMVTAGAGLAVGARGEARVTIGLADGETVPLKIDLTFE